MRYSRMCALSTVIVWTELCCWYKRYSSKATLLLDLGWSNGYKQYTVVITIWLTVTKYPYHNFKWQWILYSLRTFYLLYHCQDFYRMLRFRIKNYVRFAFTSSWYIIYVICVCWLTDVLCFCFVLSSYCVLYVQFSGLSIINYPFGIL
jgi:hypothetical protein